MREIKFRAWDDKAKAWLMGYEQPGLGGFHLDGECMLLGEWARVLDEAMHDKIDLKVMQFTGLKDKNGKEIFEGDVIKFEKGIGTYGMMAGVPAECYAGQAVVRWEAPRFKFDGLSDFYIYKLDFAEVIGNIYENAELLETK